MEWVDIAKRLIALASQNKRPHSPGIQGVEPKTGEI